VVLFYAAAWGTWHYLTVKLYCKFEEWLHRNRPSIVEPLASAFNAKYPPGSNIRKSALWTINVDLDKEGLLNVGRGERYYTLWWISIHFKEEWEAQVRDVQ